MDLNENKKNAIAFYKMAYEGNPKKAVEKYVGDEYKTMDFFRFDKNGKICEHWDSIQQIPKNSANPNTMY